MLQEPRFDFRWRTVETWARGFIGKKIRATAPAMRTPSPFRARGGWARSAPPSTIRVSGGWSWCRPIAAAGRARRASNISSSQLQRGRRRGLPAPEQSDRSACSRCSSSISASCRRGQASATSISSLKSNPAAGDRPLPQCAERSFNAISGSAGLSYAPVRRCPHRLNASRTERAPSGEELFASGGHAGTQAWELGNEFRAGEILGPRDHAACLTGRVQFRRLGLLSLVQQRYLREPGRAERLSGGSGAELAATSICPASSSSRSRPAITGSRATCPSGSPRCAATMRSTSTCWAIMFMPARAVDGRSGAPHPAAARAGRPRGAVRAELTARRRARLLRRACLSPEPHSRRSRPDRPTIRSQTPRWASSPSRRTDKISLSLSANNTLRCGGPTPFEFLKDFAPLGGRDLRATLRLGFRRARRRAGNGRRLAAFGLETSACVAIRTQADPYDRPGRARGGRRVLLVIAAGALFCSRRCRRVADGGDAGSAALWLLAFAIPSSALALIAGYRRHDQPEILAPGGAGLA